MTFVPVSWRTPPRRRTLALMMLVLTWLSPPSADAQPGSAAEANRPRTTVAQTAIDSATSPQDVEGDLLLLVEHDLFFASLTGGVEFTDNAFNDSDAESDMVFETDLIFGANTLIDNTYDATVWVNANASRYQDFDTLDSDGLTFGLAGSRMLGNFRVGAIYSLTLFNDLDNSSDDITDNAFTLHINRTWALDNGVQLYLKGQAQRFISDPDDYSATYFRATAGFNRQLSPQLALSGEVYIEQQLFDDYFEETFNDSREDTVITPSLKLQYNFRPSIALTLDVSYQNSTSSLDDFDYDATDIRPSVGFSARF